MRRARSGEGVWCLLMALATSACAKDVVDALVLPPCQSDPGAAGCPSLVWPNQDSSANSDPWLVLHHNDLIRIEPRVLLLDFYDGLPSMQMPVLTVDQVTQIATQQIAAQALGSSFHAYSDAGAPPFVNYKLWRTIDLTDPGPPPAGATHPSSSLLPLTPDGAFDPTALFTQSFGDRIKYADQANPGRNLTLCELFEKGVINEVWVSIGEGPPRGIDSLERKQVYDADGMAIPGQFEPGAGGSGDLSGIECGVTVRIAHLSPVRGLGCDLDIRSWSLQAETTLATIPYLHDNALAFFNSDFSSRFGVAFDSWDDLCNDSSETAPCVSYGGPTTVSGADPTTAPWTINAFVQGCGTATFPSNARYRDDYVNTTPVASRCAHYGVGDGPGGADLTDLYTADMVQGNANALDTLAAMITPAVALDGADCGGGWQVYLRQSIPGYRNNAHDSKGGPMKNWWPFLFY